VTDISAKKELIRAGMGWGGLPEHLVARELADGTLKALVVPEFAEAMDLFAIRRRDRYVPQGLALDKRTSKPL
jgi:DNA-binding transcriptional LysR family regulator